MPDTRVTYEDVRVLEDDGSGFTCVVLGRRVFVGRYVPAEGSTVARKGDRGRLVVSREFADEQRLPVVEALTDRQLEAWLARAELRVATAKERVEQSPDDPRARAESGLAEEELVAVRALRARRSGRPAG